MKKIFYYLLPLLLLNQSGTAQQDSLTLRITDEKGQIIIDKEECEMDADELMMAALDAGAEDFSEEEDSYEVITAPDDFSAVREALEALKIPMMEADVTMIPQTWVELSDEDDIKKLMNHDLKLLILGYKDLRRGHKFYEEKKTEIEERQKWLYKKLPIYFDKFKVIYYTLEILSNITKFLSLSYMYEILLIS